MTPPSTAQSLWLPEPLFPPPREGRTIERVEEPPERARAAAFVNRNHSYIEWTDRPSRKLYWNLWEDGQHVGVFGLSSCFSHPKAVRDYMREHDLEFNQVGHNVVYCLATDTKNAGSQFLALCRRDAKALWRERYGDDLRAFQTFILPPRTGAVYKADNWTLIGETKGETWESHIVSAEECATLPNTRTQVFADGSGGIETRHIQNVYKRTPRKLIYMRRA